MSRFEDFELAQAQSTANRARPRCRYISWSETRDGSAKAGHLGEARVRPTLEVIVTESPAHLRKVKDAETGLALIKPAA